MSNAIVRGCNNCVNVEQQLSCDECFGCVCLSGWKLKPRNDGSCLICGCHSVDRDDEDRCRKHLCQSSNVETLRVASV